jgi:hypothetical protein
LLCVLLLWLDPVSASSGSALRRTRHYLLLRVTGDDQLATGCFLTCLHFRQPTARRNRSDSGEGGNRYRIFSLAPGPARYNCEMVTLNPKQSLIWLSVVSTILVLFGIVYTLLGLAILPVDRETLLPCEGAIYGSLMRGWGTTLLSVGRLAFRRNDVGLMKGLLCGLIVWLVVEAAVSAYYKVWFNVGVDIAVLALFSIPLLNGINQAER